MNQKCSPKMREWARRMLDEAKPGRPNLMTAVRHVAGLLGRSAQTLRMWHRRGEVDTGQWPGVPGDVAEENARLCREVAESRRANEILRAARVFVARELDRPATRRSGSSTSIGSVRGRGHLRCVVCGGPWVPHRRRPL